MREYAIADVFTDRPLEGNQVAVFSDGSGLSTETMQRAARELNLSETVFLLAPDGQDADGQDADGQDADGADAQDANAQNADARARIFTPSIEMPFAGHPILGTAFVLGERDGADVVRLQTGAGTVAVTLSRRDGHVVHGEMQQPIPTWAIFDRQAELLAAVGAEASWLPIEIYDNGPRHTSVALPDAAAVAALRPDMRALQQLGELGVSCFAVRDGTVKTRMFAPGLGVPEDPATGSAAGPLAVHLARHGVTRFGQEIEISQGEEIARPSRLRAVVEGSPEQIEQVRVGGGAVIVARGTYRLD